MHILIVDDNQEQRNQISRWLEAKAYKTRHASSGEDALLQLSNQFFDLVLLDLVLPGRDGFEILAEIKRQSPDPCVIIVSAYGDNEKKLRAIEMGAFDFLDKPINFQELTARIKKAEAQFDLYRQAWYSRDQAKEQYRFDNIIGKSQKMVKIFDLVHKVCKTDTTVLLQGESGTGKEVFAQAIHHHSHRWEKSLVIADCAAMAEGVAESELFGHEKGAFTGAIRLKRGKLEQAHGGSLFIDEVGTMTAKIQMKLLRFLQEKTFERVGGEQLLQSDVRIIAATNKNLKQEIEAGSFREDLYYRLNVFPIEIPPLRDRVEDVPILVYHFLNKFNVKLKKQVRKISGDALSLLLKYRFPGNVRELENIIERAVILAETDTLTAQNIPFNPDSKKLQRERYSDLQFQEAKAEFEKDYIADMLSKTGGNISRAAELAGMDRANFKEKMKKYHLNSNHAD